MPNIKSAIKRVEVAKRNQDRNKANKSKVKTEIKKFNKVVNEKDAAKAEALLPATFSAIDKSASKGAMHKNAANRRKAVAASKLNAIKSEK